MRITLAVCTNRQIRPKTVGSLLAMVAREKTIDFNVVIAERGFTIAENRNYVVVQAQRDASDYLLFVDDDMTFEPDTLERLLAHKKEVIGVKSYSRCLPLSPTVGLMDKNGEYMHPDRHPEWEMKIPEEVFEAYFVGAGILLIDMKAFERIPKPYFSFTTDENGQVVHGEDGTFCDKVRKAGMNVWCDPTIEVGHLGEFEYKQHGAI